MSNYKVQIVFSDDHTQELLISEEEYPQFMKCLATNEPYSTKGNTFGFWVPEKNLRFVMYYKLEEKPPAKEEKNVSKKSGAKKSPSKAPAKTG